MASESVTDFALLDYIDGLVEDLRGHVPAALTKWDSDAIHRSRVATRRLKAALDLLKPVLSDEQRKPFAVVLRKLRRRLGPLRDLDVMIGHLAELRGAHAHGGAVQWLGDRLRARREAQREAIPGKRAHSRVLARLGTWWGLREEVAEAREAADSLLAQSLHLQLDAFAEQADRLSGKTLGCDPAQPQDPHAVRIAAKNFRYTLEMAGVQGHKLPVSIMRGFKRMQESLGLWHDYVVLTERAMQVSLEELLPHHDAALQARVLNLARMLLGRSSRHMDQFSKLWLAKGDEVAGAIRTVFPLTQPGNGPEGGDASRLVSESKTDRDPPGSDETPAPAASPPDAA
ncbi:MAG TPA: CHAD domain-containing protein [Tepidisphaeraceae bacterium]|nr:CHAD domain-containing protein [Tepidisphaeraceae bacterium]